MTVAGDTILGFDEHHFWPISGDRVVVRWGNNRPSRFGLLDGSGAFLWPMADGSLNSECAKTEPEAAFSIHQEGQILTRIVDKNGQTIIDSVQNLWLTDDPLLKQKGPNYHRIWHFPIQKPGKTGTLGLVNWAGKKVVPLEWDEIFYRSDDHPVVASRTVGGQKICNAFDLKTGQKLFAEDFQVLYFTQDFRRFLARKREKFAIADADSPANVRFDFDAMNVLSTGGFVVRKGSKWQALNAQGKLVGDSNFDQIDQPTPNDFFKFREKGGKKGQLLAIGRRGEQLFSINRTGAAAAFGKRKIQDDDVEPMIEIQRNDD